MTAVDSTATVMKNIMIMTQASHSIISRLRIARPWIADATRHTPDGDTDIKYKRIPTGLGMLSPVPVGIANYKEIL